MFDDLEENLARTKEWDEDPFGTFILKVELGNAAMQNPDHLANALRLVADQVQVRYEYPAPIMDANGNACGEWTVLPNEHDFR